MALKKVDLPTEGERTTVDFVYRWFAILVGPSVRRWFADESDVEAHEHKQANRLFKRWQSDREWM